MIRAYEETYLNDAMNNLGDMFDYALCDLGYEPEAFFSEFLISGVAECFENGNPKYVAGLSGPELAVEVISRTRVDNVSLACSISTNYFYIFF